MVRRKISRRTPGYLKISLWLVFTAIVVALFFLFRLYRSTFSPAVDIKDSESHLFYIPTGSDYSTVVSSLIDQGIITDRRNFEWLSEKKNLPSHIYPGRYRIQENMSLNELINLLRSGKQEPLMLTFNNIRTLGELSSVISGFLEPDSTDFAAFFQDPATPGKFGFTRESFPAMFIPNSYEFYWNTTPKEFAGRMKSEYLAFWSGNRMGKAEKMGLTPVEVITLASIVDQETLHNDENPSIAGVFINRIEQGIPLQSDPTIIFAHNDFSIKRVWNKHKKIESPYNTYRYKGLPPGPISIPSVSAIDGVLKYEKHNYIFFCAKPDFSGYHNFARTLSQHNKNARLYQQALNQRNIYR